MQQTPILALSATAVLAAVEACRFVGFDGDMVSAAGAKPFGVSDYRADPGDDYAVNVLGTAKVETGAAVARGANGLTPVMSDASGKAIPFVVAGANVIAGYALIAGDAGAGATIEVLLAP